jgi:hypothetical protein
MSPLHQIGNFLRELLLQIPLGAVRALFVLLLASLLVWVLSLPRSHVLPDRPTAKLSENLKFWAALSLVIQLLIYALL